MVEVITLLSSSMFPVSFQSSFFFQFQYLCFVWLDCGTQSLMAPRYVRIGCQRSSSRQNSSFSSFVYCSLADLDSSHFLFYYFDSLLTSFDLAFRYKTPPNAVLLQSILGCSVGLVLAHPSQDVTFSRVIVASFSIVVMFLYLPTSC